MNIYKRGVKGKSLTNKLRTKSFSSSTRDISFILTLFIFIIFFIHPISSDVVSMNAGGSNETVITTGGPIEDFFFGTGGATAPVCGNGVIESGETCDDGNIVSGDGCSSTCQTETPGGGGGGGTTTVTNISVIPTEFNLDIPVNGQIQKTIQIRNQGTLTATVRISQQNLQGMVNFTNTTLTIPTGQLVNLGVTFISDNETGFFTGKIM